MVSPLAKDDMPTTTSATLSTAWSAPHDQVLRMLTLPGSAAGVPHALRWWAHTLPGLLQRHRLEPARAGHYGARFNPNAALRESYAELFDLRHGPGGVGYPFLYAQGVNTLLQTRVLADLGVNRRHVRHLRHSTQLHAGAEAYQGETCQQLDCRLQRVVRIGPTEVLALLQTRIVDSADRLLAQVDDGFVVRELDVAYAVQADEDDRLRRAVSRMRRRQAELDAGAADVRMRQLYIAADAGRRFGRISGERSPAHVHRLGARLWGQRRPHVQSQYLRNLVARELAEWGVDQASLQLTFNRLACLGQTLHLLLQDSRFELVDEHNRLVAFGKACAADNGPA